MATRCENKSYLDFYDGNKVVDENEFLRMKPDTSPVPKLSDPAVRAKLPQPFWDGQRGADAIACYWKTWEIAFGNLVRITHDKFGVSPFIDTAFSESPPLHSHTRTSVNVGPSSGVAARLRPEPPTETAANRRLALSREILISPL